MRSSYTKTYVYERIFLSYIVIIAKTRCSRNGEIIMERTLLVARAKELGIKGWNKMKTDVLADTVAKIDRKASRKGNRSGNVPWRNKFYFVPETVVEHEGFAKAPNQVKLMLKAAIAAGIVDKEHSVRGIDIAQAAINDGMATKIEPAILFAYYRRRMEQLGLVFAGYNLVA